MRNNVIHRGEIYEEDSYRLLVIIVPENKIPPDVNSTHFTAYNKIWMKEEIEVFKDHIEEGICGVKLPQNISCSDYDEVQSFIKKRKLQ